MKASRNQSTLRGLVLLNAALLMVLGAVTFAPTADAQARARGDYIMVGGEVPGIDGAAVYIVDTINQEMMVVAYTQSTKSLEGVAYRHIGQDAAGIGRGQQRSR